MTTDLTFLTNEHGKRLKDRFEVLIKDTRFFDCLVGYFYTSGFFKIYKALEKPEKIRILIGISTDRHTFDLIEEAKDPRQIELKFSHAEVKQEYENVLEKEFEESADNKNIEDGVEKFIEWLRSKKLEIRAYPSDKIHAKVYIMTFSETDRDKGRVITGSSNFTQAGLEENLEFNVELKNRSDYDFALNKFNELWGDSVDVSEKYIETIRTKTWLNQTVSPYQLYLKFLYEYFKDELNQPDELAIRYLPEEFKELEYQEQAVLNAKRILEEYGGVFISDVVGLGKTYISAMLAGQLDGRTLVIAPPVLLEKNNPGSWPNVFSDFRVHADFESIGKLDSLLEKGVEKYTNIIIDEAHRFRNETNQTYESMAGICRGKRVILVTATPYNNEPQDILSQIKLFQSAKKSTIPNLPNLEAFFKRLEKKLKGLDRQKDQEKYLSIVKTNAKEIRENVLKYLMVRRTRTEITKYFSQDIKKQHLKFPEVEAPVPLFYELNEDEDIVFETTIDLIAKKFTYARYTPLLYSKAEITDQLEIQSQLNMGKFMKILLVKRLESSFFAFRNSIDRFIGSYRQFIDLFDKGDVYVSKKHSNKIFEFIENDDDEAIQRLLDQEKAVYHGADEFTEKFRSDLQNDLDILNQIKLLWEKIKRDPKLISFLKELHKNQVLHKNKMIVFTESRETAEYLFSHIDSQFKGNVLCYNGSSGESVRDKVIDNFDAKAKYKKDDYRILVSTEVLSEGVNLHQANVVINYDIPWNPTRMMQRVGRINRVDKIYTFNFFPTKQADNEIKLKAAAESKIHAFLSLLGGDAPLLTEGEPIGSHELFNRLMSAKTISGEDETEESELKYLNVIKTIRDENADLFNEIKRLPKKARTARENSRHANELITYFRRGKLQKFYCSDETSEAQELDFMSAAKMLEAIPETKKTKTGGSFYTLLDKNKNAFLHTTEEDVPELSVRRGRDSGTDILRILRAVMHDRRQLTDEQEAYIKKVVLCIEKGSLPKQTAKETMKALNHQQGIITNPLKVIAILQTEISPMLLEEHFAEHAYVTGGKREVILSEYFTEI
jgi:superfamily II DNA or RNA helicase